MIQVFQTYMHQFFWVFFRVFVSFLEGSKFVVLELWTIIVGYDQKQKLMKDACIIL